MRPQARHQRPTNFSIKSAKNEAIGNRKIGVRRLDDKQIKNIF
jgi:hypothetical protein